MTKIISKFLAVIMMINIISINNPASTFANELSESKTSLVKLSTYKDGNIKESIDKGQKGIDYNIDSLHIEHDDSFKIDKTKFNISKLDEYIKIKINGDTEDYINAENTKLRYNFKYDEKNKIIKVEIKEGQSDNTNMKPFILRKHSLYNIEIKEGLFIDDSGKKGEQINYTFTTKGDGLYGKDIIKDILPNDKETTIDYKKGEIIIDFIDEIHLDNDVLNNKGNYFEIRSSSIINPESPNYDAETIENINNYTISSSGSKLKISKKGELNDFATYTLMIKGGAVQLKDSRDLTNGTIITNDTQNIVFSTDNWIDSVNLSTNDGTNGWIDYNLPLGNIEDVPVNPLIQIKFKYPVELINTAKIKFSSDAHDFSIDVNKDSWINYDGSTLKLDINSLDRGGENPLRKHTAYKITIEKGALKLKGYNNSQTNSQIENEEMNVYFITGDWTTNADPGLYVTGYSSNSGKTDNLINISSTRLGKDGEIYIHFNRDIQWNKWGTNISNDIQALPYFKLYKIPSAYERDYSEKGVTFDSQFRFDKDRKIYTKNGIITDEIPLESVTRSGNKIKIKPKYELVNLNEYRIVLSNKNIVTDFHEKILISNINQKIWTEKNGISGRPEWILPDDITAEEVIEDTNSPYKKSYRLHGVPEYNEDIDKENGQPIVIYVDREVIPNPEKSDSLGGISLFEGYSYSSQLPIAKDIEWYKIEYLGKGSDKKTKISIYPKGTLDSGKFYRFKIPNNTFVTRNGNMFEFGAEFEFVVRGDKTDNTGIYIVNVTNRTSPLLINHFSSQSNPIKLNIRGYNFNESIKGIRFVRQRDGHTIRLGSEYVKFRSVTELEAEVKGNGALEFAKVRSGGVYGIYIDFENGLTATGGTISGTTLIVKERPIVLRTNPRETSEGAYIDEENIYSIGSGDNKTCYISIVFADIDNKLKLKSGLRNYEGIKIVINDEEVGFAEFVDTGKDMISETRNGEFTLRIPLRSCLNEDTKYEITIPENFVDFTDITGGTGGNEEHSWKFGTSFSPITNEEFKGSVPKDYDEKYPIFLKGDRFQEGSTVYFIGIDGKEHRAYSVDIKNVEDGQIAEVYLPRRNNKLKVGLYDIVIENDNNHIGYYRYGVLSVVPEGDHVPNEEYRIKDTIIDRYTIRDGVKEIIKTSTNELELSSRYTNQTLDLDSILGEEVLVRDIKYYGSSISTLNTKSKWADIKLTGLRRDSSREPMTIRLGRVEPAVRDGVKKKLTGDSIKSEFIQISGTNYELSSAELSIPYRESNGDKLKVLRYDEDTRRIDNNISFRVDKNDKKMIITNAKKGIFVIVE